MPYRIVKNPWAGLALTVATLVLAEIARGSDLPDLVGVALLLLALVPVAYSALSAGLLPGLGSAAVVALYTLHYTSEAAFVDLTPEVLSGGLVMLVIGVGTVAPMAYLRRRERRLVDELRSQAADLAARNAELMEANAALEAFGFVVSHDLKEPVRGIENYLDAAREEYAGSDEGRRLLGEAYIANRRMYRMLEGLLAYSRASTSPATVRDLQVPEVLRSETCRLQYEQIVRERKADLVVEEGLPTVRGDEVILSQLLGNLVLNAIRHNPRPRPTVRICKSEASAKPGRVHLVVEDDGPGFPADVMAKFAQLRGTRPATVKGGFGLVISHRAIDRLGGRMTLENLPEGKGARVHLELPGVA